MICFPRRGTVFPADTFSAPSHFRFSLALCLREHGVSEGGSFWRRGLCCSWLSRQTGSDRRAGKWIHPGTGIGLYQSRKLRVVGVGR
ncbi:hypothetical protein chiPu_0027896 [Chiloscyllium punctatum]|uniref:Uncharacterized protein n=1 Tax=Chiloscyllium punctatum TaxID=137246 RepID=A0A401TML1_CHIPU|nr:hypothetical protein [Chiloscyllium punctatum]